MREPNSRQPKDLNRLHTVLLSFYSAALLAWVFVLGAEAMPLHRRILFYWHPHTLDLPKFDYVLFYFEIYLLPTAVIFGCLQLVRLLFPAGFLLRTLGGAVAAAGCPLAIILAANLGFYQYLELVVAVVCFALWAYQRWPKSNRLNLALLCFHYALWIVFAGRCFTVWYKGEPEYFWRYAEVAYPTLGFCYTLLWAAYFRQSQRAKGVSASPLPN